MPFRRACSALLATAALVAVAAGCGGSGANKAGGSEARKPLVLTLESEDDLILSGAPEFAEAVGRLSGGSMRIAMRNVGRGTEIDYERGVAEDVRSGKRRVLASPLAARMLDGVEKVGVVGVALLPGPLRRPLGRSHAFVPPGDYRGATIGIRPGGVAQETLRALGAVARGYVPGSLAGLEGVESDPKGISYNGWDRGPGTLTTNVVVWAKPYSIVISRKAFAALTPEQQEILLRAGRAARAPELRQIGRDEAAALAQACEQGQLTFATASASELAALRASVQPVYDRLERDPLTRRSIAAIESMRGRELPAAPPRRCRNTIERTTAGSSALQGRWKMSCTRNELIAAGISQRNLKGVPPPGTVMYDFRGGRFRTIIDTGRVIGKGTYTVGGGVMNLVYAAPAPSGYVAEQVYRQRWSV